MQEEELNQYARQFLKQHYHLSFDIPLKRNNRLRSTHGRFIMRNNQAEKIELAGYLLDYGTTDIILGVLKHECIHYALFKQGINHRDGDPEFEAELMKHQAPKTRTLLIGKYYLLQCCDCKKVMPTRKKRVAAYPEHYRTACCQAKLTIVGEQVYNGNDKKSDS